MSLKQTYMCLFACFNLIWCRLLIIQDLYRYLNQIVCDRLWLQYLISGQYPRSVVSLFL